MIERQGATTFNGAPMTLQGPELKPGERAPEFSLLDGSLKERHLSEFKGKVKIISTLLSVDTGICSAEVMRFEEELAKIGNGIAMISVSMDLPFTQGRFCSEKGVKHTVLSDHKDAKFGTSYGVLVKDMRVLSRAIFVVNRDGIITYVEYVKEIASNPDFDKALSALKEVLAQ